MSKIPIPEDAGFFRRRSVDGSLHPKIRPWRWMTAILLASLFLLSYGLDIQMLEGSMVASRLMGFHLVDLYCGLEVIAAHGEIATNLLLGMIFVGVVYWILGGRSFCAWACPFGLLSEWADILHKSLVRRGLVKKRKRVTTKIKYVLLASFLASSFASGYLVYQHFNVVGLLSRLMIYGLFESGLLVVFVLAVEVFFYERLWCRSICPSGAVYGLLNPVSVIRLEADRDKCDKCGACTPVCHVPEALGPVFVKKDGKVFLSSTDCTLCCRCLDSCSRDVFKVSHRLKGIV